MSEPQTYALLHRLTQQVDKLETATRDGLGELTTQVVGLKVDFAKLQAKQSLIDRVLNAGAGAAAGAAIAAFRNLWK